MQLIERQKSTACVRVYVREFKHKKFDLPFLPCRIPSSTPSLSEMRNLDSFCPTPAEQRSEEKKKEKRKTGGVRKYTEREDTKKRDRGSDVKP